MRLRLTVGEYAGSFGGAGLIVLAMFALAGGFHGQLLGFLIAPPFLVGGLVLFRLVDRHVKDRVQTRTADIRDILVRNRDR